MLMALKNSQILFDDSSPDKASSICWGRRKALDVESSGLFLAELVRLTCFSMKSVAAFLSFFLTSSLYFALLPFL